MSKAKDTPWVVVGGKIGETGYCRRCGAGLILPMPVPLQDFTTAIKRFGYKHANCPVGCATEPQIVTPWDWLASRWPGVSSASIWSVMMDFPSPSRKYDHPYDPVDFHRCYRLLTNFPAWKLRMSEVAKRFPFWGPYVREWADLTALYEHDVNGEDARTPALYNRMKELEAEAQHLKRGKGYWTDEDAA